MICHGWDDRPVGTVTSHSALARSTTGERVYSRRGNDWTARFGPIGGALKHLPANGFVIDGEVVVPDDNGRPNFGWLQDDLAEGRTDRMLYYAFELLWLDGGRCDTCQRGCRRTISGPIRARESCRAIRTRGRVFGVRQPRRRPRRPIQRGSGAPIPSSTVNSPPPVSPATR